MDKFRTPLGKCRFCGARVIQPGLIGGHCSHCGSYGAYDSPFAHHIRERTRQVSESCWQDALAYTAGERG